MKCILIASLVALVISVPVKLPLALATLALGSPHSSHGFLPLHNPKRSSAISSNHIVHGIPWTDMFGEKYNKGSGSIHPTSWIDDEPRDNPELSTVDRVNLWFARYRRFLELPITLVGGEEGIQVQYYLQKGLLVNTFSFKKLVSEKDLVIIMSVVEPKCVEELDFFLADAGIDRWFSEDAIKEMRKKIAE
jgi:hypothetical protein